VAKEFGMNVLLIGSGGRENALAWKLAQSSMLDELYVAPGNPGTLRHGRNVNLDLHDPTALRKFMLDKKIRMVVVGPEAPLTDGLHDRIAEDPKLKGVIVIGPKAAGAKLEGSKEFAKEFMLRHNIPTAAFRAFGRGELAEAQLHIDRMPSPYVIKADGLAQGKGVVIAQTKDEAKEALKSMLGGKDPASERVLLEQYLSGHGAVGFSHHRRGALQNAAQRRRITSASATAMCWAEHRWHGRGEPGPLRGQGVHGQGE
jgi:phosphoribosylamine--glycine ligase